MNSMPKSTNLNIRLDKELKEQADKLFKKLGLNMSSAINLFLTQSVKEQGIPFLITDKKPTKKLQKALQEADAIASGKKETKSYTNFEELLKDLDK